MYLMLNMKLFLYLVFNCLLLIGYIEFSLEVKLKDFLGLDFYMVRRPKKVQSCQRYLLF